jgi:cysteinyl-tRNA synthetase, unknown class
MRFVAMTLACTLLACACFAGSPATAPTTGASPPQWNQVRHFVYQLQNIDLDAIARIRFDLAVIDYSADGSEAARFTRAQIAGLQKSGGGKRVLAYMSIGEAEDYRWYWRAEWKTSPPPWLGPLNPDWAGNYKVKYWDPAWQQIVFDYLDKIIDAGFDGVYLDVVDAYYFWGPEGESGLKRKSSEQEMVDFVKSIATHAREERGEKEFAVFVQNAAELAGHADYLAAVAGIGQEDLFFNGNKKQPARETTYTISFLNKFKAAGKPVLVIDYPTQVAKVEEVYTRAKEKGFIPYVPRRELDRLTVNVGHEPK